jgi:transcriptional regulator with XRE-family HTH domain
MPPQISQTTIRRRVLEINRALGVELQHLRDDAGLSRVAVAGAAGIADPYLGRIQDGGEHPSNETLVRLGLVLGADLRVRLYPNTGPLIPDRHQAAMLEVLLGILHSRWRAFVEAAVHRPDRGWIDAVLHDGRASLAVATEIQSELRRLEQLIRWSTAMAASLPSWDGWDRRGEEPRIDRLLIVRRTRATRDVAAAHDSQLRVAFPAHPDDALAALTGTASWPGAALVWSVVDGRGARLVSGR